ncbi:6-phosphofructokinase [Rhodonellum psychrophilum GCM71 = DSM 17998]|uniref:ATP-dependent 6-phosphofructokinase n=2 Tax=Rhodonellum TaxID=336827 RepID=U5C4S6_9BACT|nr:MULTISPECIES: 6-phosphofructokinase [Rhodonellum]ERM83911.1 6-phosphofructokinase [Rhodonellum psychrophilum GCM71 = DSM 17998]MDO9550898.1 6-phosphofructokinase [Rhodonellum sp.]SDZ04823.1 6-phosphofructokinase [Rhodonellum ikkaensis]
MKKIAVFTSGGDAPGMNACIRAVVRTSIFYGLEIYGISYGFDGMIKGGFKRMQSNSVSNIVQRGGTILKSARSEEFMTKEGRQKAYDQLKEHEIEGVVAIGGDGTFTGAKVFFEEFGIPIIGCPGTIDNDIYGTDYTIGFDTAVNTALEAIDKIRDTAAAHDRIFFVEVMGRDSGYIAVECGIGGGAEFVFVPETETDLKKVVKSLKSLRKSKSSSLIVVAEGDEEGTAEYIMEKVKGKLNDADKEFKVTTLGHIQRGGNPTARDRVLASRCGMAAVDGLIAGKSNCMAGVVNGDVIYTPFEDCIGKTKPLKEDHLKLIEILSI